MTPDRPPMTPERLKEIAERLEKATKGPWQSGGYNGADILGPVKDAFGAPMVIVQTDGGLYWEQDRKRGRGPGVVTEPYEAGDDQVFVEHAWLDIRDLLADNARLRGLILEMEWAPEDCCLWCSKPSAEGHAESCSAFSAPGVVR